MDDISFLNTSDYLVIGQGLAGTVLAHQLIQQGKRLQIIDDSSLSSSSKVAAGMFNPVVFKRLVKSWMADEQLAFAEPFYQNLEVLLSASFFHCKPLVKIFTEEQEKSLWEKKRSEELSDYLSPLHADRLLQAAVDTPLGYATVNGAGHLDVPLFLSLSRTYFQKLNVLSEQKFDPVEVKLVSGGVSYQSFKARKLVFCEGHLTGFNPWFKWLKFNLAKGEVLTIRIPGFTTDKIINKGVFILPLGNDLYRVGATFTWDKLDEIPTEAGKNDLLIRLKKVLKLDFEVVDHKAGIRPTVIDRRPLIGTHPQHPELCVFNGMGSKGVMIAPLFAHHLIQHLEEGKPLDPEVDIRRFFNE